MSPEACNLMRGNRLIEDALFGPNAPDTWPPGAGKKIDTTRFDSVCRELNNLSGGENGNVSLLAAELDRRPTHGGHSPLANVVGERNPVDGATNIGVNAAQNHFCTCAGFRIASDCPKHAR